MEVGELESRITQRKTFGFSAPVREKWTPLLHFLVVIATTAALAVLVVLSLHAARFALSEWRGEREVNVLLRVDAHHERRLVDNAAAHADVALLDKDTRVVHALGELLVVEHGLQTAGQEVLDLQVEAQIEALVVRGEEAHAPEAAHEGIAFEQTTGVLLFECEKLTSGRADLGEGDLNAPDLTLVSQAELAHDLQLAVEALLLIGAARLARDFTVISVVFAHRETRRVQKSGLVVKALTSDRSISHTKSYILFVT